MLYNMIWHYWQSHFAPLDTILPKMDWNKPNIRGKSKESGKIHSEIFDQLEGHFDFSDTDVCTLEIETNLWKRWWISSQETIILSSPLLPPPPHSVSIDLPWTPQIPMKMNDPPYIPAWPTKDTNMLYTSAHDFFLNIIQDLYIKFATIIQSII